jgi:hypothetical protein
MLIRRTFSLTVAIGVLISGSLLAVPVAAQGATSTGQAASDVNDSSCFLRRQWTGNWKVASDSRTVYIRVSNGTYALSLGTATPLLQSAFAVLIDNSSTDSICGPLDLRLVVTDRVSGPIPLIVRKLTRLTDAEVAALPKKMRP